MRMEMQELEITISMDGQVQVGVKGAHGQECLSLTRGIEDALGEVTERNFRPEYYEQEVEEFHTVQERRK
jgi:hypothetical protein